jgi:hypothetical protein
VPSEVKDFTRSSEPKRFRIDDDVFECAARLPVGMVQRFIRMTKPVNTDDEDAVAARLDAMMEILDSIMFDASAERFAHRMRSKEEPIDTQQMADVMGWLMQEYGERPTVPAPSSSNEPHPNGPTSTDGVQDGESISTDSISAVV